MHLIAFPSSISNISLACLLACSAISASAQVRPDAGQTQREVQPTAPVRPAPSTAPISVQALPAAAGSAAGSMITPSSFSFSGHSVLSAQELGAALQEGIGKAQSLAQLNQLVAKITALYRSKGYPFARAFLPPQDIKDGQVSVRIVEGQHGTTQLTNTSSIRNSVIQSVLAPLASGQPIQDATLQRQMLLLQDLPGIQPNAALVPGAAVGTADLRVAVNPGTAVFGSGEIDNFGGAFTGRTRLSAGLGFNNLAGLGDQLNLRGMSSGQGLTYLRAGYQMPIGGQGFVLSANASTLRYKLGGKFAALDADGKATNASVSGSYPLIRSANQNLRAGLAYERKTSQDNINSLLDVTDKTISTWTANFSGDVRDSSSVTAYTAVLTSGRVSIDPLHLTSDQITAQTAGSFSKLNIGVQRFQALNARTELAISYAAQLPSKNLTSVEKMSVGGNSGVRAYSTSEASGDSGHLLNVEVRYTLQPGWQISGFVDAAQTTINKTLWAGALAPGASNKRSISGAGLGLQWSGPSGTRIKAQIATRLGNEAATADKDSRTRFWLQTSIAF